MGDYADDACSRWDGGIGEFDPQDTFFRISLFDEEPEERVSTSKWWTWGEKMRMLRFVLDKQKEKQDGKGKCGFDNQDSDRDLDPSLCLCKYEGHREWY